MADIIDQANDLAELHLKISLAQHNNTASKESAVICIQCDEDIPHKRRSALIGVQTCFTCQQEIELKNKQQKGR